MIDWLNPTDEMLACRGAGRQDRNQEVENLELEIESLNEENEKLEKYKKFTEWIMEDEYSLDSIIEKADKLLKEIT